VSFLARTNVTRLYVCPSSSADGAAQYLSAVQNLNILILDLGSRPGDALLEAITYRSESNMECTPRCPALHTLYLVHGSLRNETVQEAVQAHPLIKKLRFVSCYLEPFDEELLYWLKPIVKDAKCYIRPDKLMSLDWYLLMN
jgi:hypothetical protein